MKFIPQVIKTRVRQFIEAVIRENAKPDISPIDKRKFQPFQPDQKDYILPEGQSNGQKKCDEGIPFPPKDIGTFYGQDEEAYLQGGKGIYQNIFRDVESTEVSIAQFNRILDFGCGAGRIIRHFKSMADSKEIWGTDISARSIFWCQQNLTPPFHFAINTTIPHLPFEDRYFDLIYGGSVFTHIDDLAGTWLLELRRILSPQGRLYITIHDKHTISLLETEKYAQSRLVKNLKNKPIFNDFPSDMNVLAIGRDADSQIFYDIEYFKKLLQSAGLTVMKVIHESYGYQTALVIKRV